MDIDRTPSPYEATPLKLVVIDGIVWKQYVLHVVLWLLGPYLTSQNLPQIFLTGWMLCI